MILASTSDFGLSFLLEILGLVIVIVLIARYIAPPLNRAMNRRLDVIRGQLAAGDAARDEAARLVSERADELLAAKDEALELVEQSKRTAELIVAEGRRRAEEERDRIGARTQVEIAAARARARHEVLSDLGSVIVAATEIVVRAELDDGAHHRLIAEAIGATESESAEPEAVA